MAASRRKLTGYICREKMASIKIAFREIMETADTLSDLHLNEFQLKCVNRIIRLAANGGMALIDVEELFKEHNLKNEEEQ